MSVNTEETRFLLTAKDKTKVAFKGVKSNLKGVSSAVTGLHTKLLALAGIGGLGAVLHGIIDTNAELQTLRSSLKSVTGSADNADKAFAQIKQFAKTTPFDLKQVTEGFIKLKALGLDPSEAAMRSYGNTASAMGKDMNQMIEAVADAATGEFERLKEFGIKAHKQGENVSFTFQGITTTVKNSSAEITKYLQSIGNNQFGTAMADQMGNLKPAFSNMQQAFSDLSERLGKSGLNDIVKELAVNTTHFVDSFDAEKLKEIGIQIGAIGAGMGAISDAAGSVTDFIGKWWAKGDLSTPKSSFIDGGAAGYKPGDFNNAKGDFFYTEKRVQQEQQAKQLRDELTAKYAPANIDALKKSFEPKTDDAKETNKLLEKNNEILDKMTSVLEGSLGIARAG